REAEIERRYGHSGQAVLATGKGRERIELDEIEDLGDRHRDHGEIDACSPKGNQADQIADDTRYRGAEKDGRQNMGKSSLGQQIGGEHAAGAIEGGLPEG